MVEMRGHSRVSEQARPSSISHALPIELVLLPPKGPFQVWFPLKEGLRGRKELREALTCYRPSPIPISSGLLKVDTV